MQSKATLKLTWEQNVALVNLISAAQKWYVLNNRREDLEEDEQDLISSIVEYDREFADY